MKNITIIYTVFCLSGCANPIWNESWHVGDNPLDYGRLFTIAAKLLADDKAANLGGLAAVGIDTGQFVNYFEATKLALKAAAAIRGQYQPRDLRVAAIVRTYYQ